MATYRYVSFAVLEMLKQTGDDADININLVNFWVQVISARLRFERTGKRISETGAYIKHFPYVAVNLDNTRKYFELPESILDLEFDNAIELVTYLLEDFDYCDTPMQIPFEKTSPSKIWSLYSIPIRKPNPNKVFMAREGGRVYLYGIECVDVSYVEVWLKTSVNPSYVCDLDSIVPVEDDQIEILIKRVYGAVRFGMIVKTDKDNEGSDTTTSQRNKTAIAGAQVDDTQQTEQQQ